MEGGNTIKIGAVCTLKFDISSPKFYELLLKTELKGDTSLEINNFYKHIKMCLNTVYILQEYFYPSYRSIKRHS